MPKTHLRNPRPRSEERVCELTRISQTCRLRLTITAGSCLVTNDSDTTVEGQVEQVPGTFPPAGAADPSMAGRLGPF